MGFELGFEKNDLLGNGIRTPPSRPSLLLGLQGGRALNVARNGYNVIYSPFSLSLVFFSFSYCLIVSFFYNILVFSLSFLFSVFLFSISRKRKKKLFCVMIAQDFSFSLVLNFFELPFLNLGCLYSL